MSDIRIALAGNPNSGKTTLFNALTGSNQYVGNWPGVTVEKKEGKLKNHEGVIVTDLPGIYSLSPYTLEEVVARKYLINEKPDVILNIIDGTNLERNLYLTTQLTEIGIPVVICINMIDEVEKNGDKIDTEELSKRLGCRVVKISALKEIGIIEASEEAILAAKHDHTIPMHSFSGIVEHALAHIEEACLHDMPLEQQRWYSIKIFERDEKVISELNIDKELLEHINLDIKDAEEELDDTSDAIIINERYSYIEKVINDCYKRKTKIGQATSDLIDNVVTSKHFGLPIFAIIMFLVYYISMVSIGQKLTDWTNDGLFGDGWHLFGIGSKEYDYAKEKYNSSNEIIDAFIDQYGIEDMKEKIDVENEFFSKDESIDTLNELINNTPQNANVTYEIIDEETLNTVEISDVKKFDLEKAIYEYKNESYKENFGEPKEEAYGIWVKGIPLFIEELLDKGDVSIVLKGLILNGIVAGVGAVLGFLPQLLVLFFLLSFLEACGYMSRIAFVLDKLFRKFGLSGKSFIPILVGTGCGVPGIMASRTIESEANRKMTIMTTTFIPCSAKIPFIAMIAGAIFGNSPWVATSAYFVGMISIIISGLILKNTKPFKMQESPFVMELPSYHLPTLKNVLSTTWDRGLSFVKKAGTVILISSVVVWFLSYFGFVDGNFTLLNDNELDKSMLAFVGNKIAFIFSPLGFGTWQAAVATLTGLVAKENLVGTLGVLYGGSSDVYQTLKNVFTPFSGYSFLVFNLLCAPCVAAMSTIAKEMKSWKWTLAAISYQCIFAYIIALIVNTIGRLF